MSKVHIYNPIIYDIALFQALKRNYAVNGHEMYCTCVFFYLCVTHNGHVQSQSYQTVRGFKTKCNNNHLIVQYLMQMTFSYDSTMTTNDLNMP